MSGSHAHHDKTAPEAALLAALGLTSTFLVVEVVAAFVTGSLALLSDAGHMFTDAAALAVSLAAIRIGKRPSDRKRTFGYYRFEILAATFNAVLLFLVALYILYEAYKHFGGIGGGESKQSQVHKASGTVTTVEPEKASVTISHGPVQSMNWPSMVMAFKVKDKTVLDNLKQGEKVEFSFVQSGRDYTITQVK